MKPGLLVMMLSCSLVAQAGIKTDGTLRPAQTLSGPQFAVTPDLGRQVGGNLFHSFAEFNLAADESVRFSGPTSVHNVLARVTGGGNSTIDATGDRRASVS
jgi:large exoprotein involved in heme utilization and adhesion